MGSLVVLLDHLLHKGTGQFENLENIGFKSKGHICENFNTLKEDAA